MTQTQINRSNIKSGDSTIAEWLSRKVEIEQNQDMGIINIEDSQHTQATQIQHFCISACDLFLKM